MNDSQEEIGSFMIGRRAPTKEHIEWVNGPIGISSKVSRFARPREAMASETRLPLRANWWS